MTKFPLLLALALPLVSNAQSCEAPTEVRTALTRQPARAVLQQFPDDVWVHRAYQDTFRQGPIFRQPVIDEYKDLLAKHADNADYLYLYGRVLVGTKTPDAIAAFDQALSQDPHQAAAHLALVEIYRAPSFKDPRNAQLHLEAWMKACPSQLQGFHDLERMENSDFLRAQVARFRPLLATQPDSIAIAHYPLLWSLEFQAHSPAEYPQVREGVRKDLLKLRAMDLGKNSQLATALREGYKLVDDQASLKWLEEQSPAKSAIASHAAMDAFQEWQKSHLYPTVKPGETVAMDAYAARNKALLEATGEWIEKWPDDHFVWLQRLMALQMNRETPDSEVERAAAGLLRTTRSASQAPTLQIASLYLQRNIHLNEIPELVKKGLDDLDKSSSSASSDLYPAGSGPQNMRFNTRMSGLNTLTDAYLKAHQPAKALEVLADVRKTLDQNKPSDSTNDNDRHNWSRSDASYWDKMGRIAEDQGRKLEALTFYQNLIRGGSSIGNQEYIRRKARVQWIDLGGTDTGWEVWLTNSAPARPIAPAVVATASTGWEKLNKPMPDFELPDMTGKTWRLTDLRGKTTLINVWATWCGPCKMELPQLQKLYDKLKNRDDIRIITLNTDDNPGVIESFLRETQYTFPVLPARAYVDKLIPSLSIPRNWIVDREAVLRLESVGYGGDGDKWVDRIIETIKEWQ